MVRLGIAERTINPPQGSSLVGYFSPRPVSGVLDDLKVVSLCFDDGRSTAFVVSFDLVWVATELSEKIRTLARSRLGGLASHMSLHGTHTHTGPLPGKAHRAIYTENFTVPDEYLERLPVAAVEAIEESYANRFDARVACGSTQVSGISFNRRYLMKDGRVVTNPTVPGGIVKPAGPVDTELCLLKVCGADGALKALALNFANHPDTLGGNEVSGDWPAMTRNRLSRRYGVPVVLFNGACGDLNHLDPFNSETRNPGISGKIAAALEQGAAVLEPALAALPAESLVISETIARLPRRVVTQAETERAAKTMRAFPGTLRALVAQALLMQAEKKEAFVENPMMLVGIDRMFGALCVSGEIFTEIGLAFKRLSPFDRTMVVENCDATLGYIPTAKAFEARVKNLAIRPEEFAAIELGEAIGIDASYETSHLACEVDERAEAVLVDAAEKLFSAVR